MAEVCLVRGAVIVVGLSQDEDVVAPTEGVFEDGGRAKVDIGVVTRSLVSRGAVEIPDTELLDARNLLCDGLLGVEGQYFWRDSDRAVGRRKLKSMTRHARRPRSILTVVFERRPPSPSIQTSVCERSDVNLGVRGKRWTEHTLGLDLLALGKSKVGGEEVGAVCNGHGVAAVCCRCENGRLEEVVVKSENGGGEYIPRG